ncbi:hypothetical protein P4C99_21685 [Pontiellaceae bacterium B1224]|nr:hypothetical protein [Pontiellaceae bacterium B1224]
MKKKIHPQEYGKPYTPKEFRQVGIGMIFSGIIVLLFGVSVYKNGSEEQLVITKFGNQIQSADPHSSMFLIIAIAGCILIIAGLFICMRGKKIKN